MSTDITWLTQEAFDRLEAELQERSGPRRSEITKRLWDYIKKNGLQDQKVKTNIHADAKLKPVFGGKDTVTMFEMTKLVSGHIKKI